MFVVNEHIFKLDLSRDCVLDEIMIFSRTFGKLFKVR